MHQKTIATTQSANNVHYGSVRTSQDEVTTPAEIDNTKKIWTKTFLAYGICVSSMGLFCTSLVCVQVLDGVLPMFELNGFRYAANLLLMIPYVIKNRDISIPRSLLPLVVIMIIAGNVFNITYYEAAVYLPVGTVFAFTNSIMIIFNAFTSICIKSERQLSLYVGAVVVVVGLFLITQPPFLFSGNILPPPPVVNWTSPCVEDMIVLSNENGTVIDAVGTRDNAWIGYLYVFLAGACNTLFFHTIKLVVARVSPFLYTFWATLLSTFFSLIMTFSVEKPVLLYSPLCWLMLVGHCIGTSQSTIILPWCMQHLSPTIAAMVNSFQLVVLVILQYTLLKDIKPGNGNWVELMGAALVFFGVLICPLWHLFNEQRAGLQKGPKYETLR